MATGGQADVNLSDTGKLHDLENPVWCNIHGSVSYISRVLANFVLKFTNFLLPWQQRRSEVNFSHTVKLSDPENPNFGANILHL